MHESIANDQTEQDMESIVYRRRGQGENIENVMNRRDPALPLAFWREAASEAGGNCRKPGAPGCIHQSG